MKKQMARLLVGMYKLSKPYLFDDGGSSADTCFDMEQRGCLQPTAFLIPFSRRTCTTPSTYVYTSFVNDLVLAKSVAVGKMFRQTLLLDHLLYWPHIVWACCHHYIVMVPGLLPIFLHGCEIKSGSGMGMRLGVSYLPVVLCTIWK